MTFRLNPRTICLPVLIVCLSMACTQKTDDPNKIHTSELPLVELDHLFTISDSEEIILRDITGVKSDSEGRIYLTDQRALQIHVFDGEGNYITSIGRDGSGPGEFQSLLRIYIDQHDRLYAYDVQQNRNTLFTENNNSWEPVQVFMIEGQRYMIESADSDGNVILRQSVIQYPETGAYWYEHELAAGNLDSGLREQNVLAFKEMGFLVSDGGFMVQIPFGRTTNLATDHEGNLYLVWNERFELAVYNAQLEWIDSLSVPVPNQPVTPQERNAAIDRLDDSMKSLGREHTPETRPVISGLFVDRSKYIWLRTFDSPEYLVLNSDGTPLGSFDLENRLSLMHVDENRLYALKVGDEGYEIHAFEYRL